jgi:hypothetical protein
VHLVGDEALATVVSWRQPRDHYFRVCRADQPRLARAFWEVGGRKDGLCAIGALADEVVCAYLEAVRLAALEALYRKGLPGRVALAFVGEDPITDSQVVHVDTVAVDRRPTVTLRLVPRQRN